MSEERSRVMLWSVPRGSSTVFCRSISRIPDIEIWMEPYGYAHIAEINAKMEEGVVLPREYNGNEKIYERVAEYVSAAAGRRFSPEALSYSNAKNNLEGTTAKYVFVKDLSYGMQGDGVTRYLPNGFRYSFLIRNPFLVYAGVHKMYYNHFKSIDRLLPEEKDDSTFDMRNHNELGSHEDYFKTLRDLWVHVRSEVDPNAVVLDSTDLLNNPSRILPRYCEAVGLPYDEAMLSWNTNLEEIASWNWGSDWAGQDAPVIFYNSVISSTCFKPPNKPLPRDQLTDDVIELSEAAMPFYEEMYRHRLGGTLSGKLEGLDV